MVPRPRQDTTAPFPRRGDYTGVARCIECHQKKHDQLLAGHHGGILAAQGLDGCETCHGPGRAHADDPDTAPEKITLPAKLAAEAQVGFCGRCHQEQARGHAGDLPGFLAAGKSCTDCHTVHAPRSPPAHPGIAFATRAMAAAVTAVGASKCRDCHPRRDALLATSHHASLAGDRDETGCEHCHGNGALHVETGGLARLITRPDHAGDGIATCRSCHPQVDAEDFHWRGRHKPLLSAGATCTTCHTVHTAVDTGAAAAALAGAPLSNRACSPCHTPAMCVLPGTVHEPLGRLDGPLTSGCAACHPGSLAHLASGGNKRVIESMHGSPAMVQQQICLGCHGREQHLAHVLQGSHQRNEIGCLWCHSPAAPRGKVQADAEQKCGRCHADVAAQFRLPNHHPVPEGRMACTSCHEVHGARPRLRDLDLRQDVCLRCHRQYRGPFVFAHQAGRQDGCVICHLPHGSPNRRLLQQTSSQQNCIACHGDFPSFHNQNNVLFTNCLNCHTEVHGSNHSRFLFR